MNEVTATRLSVKGESLQQLYTEYTSSKYVVNRRYQRKLVWTVEEKQSLIDSIVKGLPIPLILLAEAASVTGADHLEIIDGLQRLDAVFSFMENQYPLGGEHFDLEALADTKFARDSGSLAQLEPVMSREVCKRFANYQIPVSTYAAATEDAVDEVFRRINSSGRHLSLQEIRQAGATDSLADLVRELSATVRGDASMSHLLPLAAMKRISITNRDLDYGIPVEEVFWVKEGILEPDSVRESGDEEFVLDLLLDLILDSPASTGARYRNSAYGLKSDRTSTDVRLVTSRLSSVGASEINALFLSTLEVFNAALEHIDVPLARWVVTQQRYRGIRRHFHAMFIAVAQLIRDDGLELVDPRGFAQGLKRFWDRDLTIAPGGGDWGAARKVEVVDMVRARLRSHFHPVEDPHKAVVRDTIVQFEAALNASLTEEAAFELKIGFTRLDVPDAFAEKTWDKVLKSAAAMANRGPGVQGRILIGVADDEADAQAVARFAGIQSIEYQSFHIVGTQHELDALGKSVDEMWRFLVEKVSASRLERPFAEELCRTLQPFRYKGLLIWQLSPQGTNRPVTFDGKFFDRRGPQTVEISGSDLVGLVQRFPVQ